MGKDWDVVSAKEWGEAMMPHLHPGALVLMFGGTRTWHKLASGMEDAGFEMWDTLMWLYGQGFPKGQDISKLIDKANGNERTVIGIKPGHEDFAGRTTRGHLDFKDGSEGFDRPWMHDDEKRELYHMQTAPGSDLSAPWSGWKTTALKPAWEPILAFKKPLDGTYAAVAVKYGSGALNVDGGRIRLQDGDDPRLGGKGDWGTKSAAKNVYEGGYAGERVGSSELGRYPANLILDEESGVLPSRFFYCAKASAAERNAGLDSLPDKAFGMSNQAKAEIKRGTESFENSELGVNTVKKVKNHHPTVKPLSLTQYLATLLLPPSSISRRLLVPFSGSGSEMIGALKAGWDEVVGIEREADYCQIAEARLIHHEGT